jgi:proline iminopeptidase
MILMGSSWGGTLVASYMARHPQHVARAILTSPAPMDPAAWPSGGSVSSRLPPRQRGQADDLLPDNPRFVLWYVLGGIDPEAAHHLVSDREADAYFNTYLHLITPGTVCNAAHAPGVYQTGNGFYDNMFTTEDEGTGREQGSVPRLLAQSRIPTLILTGACNYVPWAPTRQYATTLPDSTLVCFPHAGHVIYLDQPGPYMGTIRAFLLDQPLPVAPWRSSRPC